MQTSVQLYTVREPLVADFGGTLQRLADIGFTAVEAFDFVGTADVVDTGDTGDAPAAVEETDATDKAQRYAQALKAAGLIAPSGHAHLVGQDITAAFDAAEIVGVKTVIEPMVRDDKWATAEDAVRIAESLNAAAKVAALRGLRVGYHNHNWELATKYDGVPALEFLAQHLDPEVVLELDLYWAWVGGVDPVGLLERLGERVQLVHVKDGPTGGGLDAQIPAGTGDVPLRAALAAAPWLDLAIVEFDVYGGDIFDGVTNSLRWLEAATG